MICIRQIFEKVHLGTFFYLSTLKSTLLGEKNYLKVFFFNLLHTNLNIQTNLY